MPAEVFSLPSSQGVAARMMLHLISSVDDVSCSALLFSLYLVPLGDSDAAD